MAITIQATPAAYSSVHGDLIYTVAEVAKTADPVLYPNYKFLADIYVNGVLKNRIKKVPNPVTRIGIFNVGQIVRSYLATIFYPTFGYIQAMSLEVKQFYLDIQLKFGEEYSYTEYTNLTTDSSRKFFNHYNSRQKAGATSLSDFTNKIASNRPLTIDLLLSSRYGFIPYFPTTTATVDVIVTTHGGGTNYSTTFTPINAFDMQVINVAPANLNAIAPGTINASTEYYTVQIGAQTVRVNLICEAIHEQFTIHFLNQYGAFDTKIFTKLSRKVLKIEKKDFGKLPYTVDPSGIVSYKNSSNVYNETRSVYSSQYKESLVLNSDLLSDSEYRWLSDLILSPMVYIEDGTDLFPCIISESNYEVKKFINDELTNLTINVEYGDQLNAQYR